MPFGFPRVTAGGLHTCAASMIVSEVANTLSSQHCGHPFANICLVSLAVISSRTFDGASLSFRRPSRRDAACSRSRSQREQHRAGEQRIILAPEPADARARQ